MTAREHSAEKDAGLAELRGMRFRVEVACLGYQSLTDDDVPQEYVGTELDAYKEGASDAARAILSELTRPLPLGPCPGGHETSDGVVPHPHRAGCCCKDEPYTAHATRILPPGVQP